MYHYIQDAKSLLIFCMDSGHPGVCGLESLVFEVPELRGSEVPEYLSLKISLCVPTLPGFLEPPSALISGLLSL